jgi:hypothetical protein
VVLALAGFVPHPCVARSFDARACDVARSVDN